MAEKRKSVFKHPSRCRRNRSSTPTPDFIVPHIFQGPELFIPSPILAFQTRPVYSSAIVDSSLRGVSFSSIGHGPIFGFKSHIVSLIRIQSLQISVYFPPSLVLSKISQADRQHSLHFHRR